MDVPAPRPNPFAIPSGTLIRFLLLIVAACAAALNGLSQKTAVALGVHRADVIAYQVCVQEKMGEAVARRQARPDDTGLADTPNIYDPILECHDPRSDVGWWPHILALALFWLLVLVVYWYLPKWRIRRRRLRPLDADRFPELSGYLRDLQREAGVQQRVTYLLEPLNPTVTGLAFGRVHRRYVVLSGGLVALFTRDRPALRTVVLHELAHIRNRDLDITFITIAVWRLVAFLLVWGLLAFLLQVPLGMLPGYGIAVEGATTVQTVLLVVFVPLLRNAVLRSRELYADARTAQWDDSEQSLRHLFDTYSTRDHHRGGPWRVHPPMKDRRTALTDARNLFTMGFWEALAFGIMVTFTVDSISDLLSRPRSGSLVNFAVGVLVAGSLLVAGMGFAIWRETLRSFVTRTPLRVESAGYGLGTGLVLGAAVTPTNVFSFYGTQTSPFGILVPGLILLFCSGFLIVRWIALVTRCWMPVFASRERPLRVILGTLIAMSVPLAVWLGLVLVLPDAAFAAQTMTYPHQPGVVVFAIVSVVVALSLAGVLVIPLLALALLPLLGATWPGSATAGSGASRRIALDPLPADWLPTRPDAQWRTAIRIAVLSAAAGTGLALLFGGVLVTRAGISTGAAVMTFGSALLAGLAQVAAAVLASVRTRNLRSLYGIVAAFLAGSAVLLVVFTGWRLVAWVSPGAPHPSPAPMGWGIAVLVFGWGMLAAAIVALITATLVSVIRPAAEPLARHGPTVA